MREPCSPASTKPWAQTHGAPASTALAPASTSATSASVASPAQTSDKQANTNAKRKNPVSATPSNGRLCNSASVPTCTNANCQQSSSNVAATTGPCLATGVGDEHAVTGCEGGGGEVEDANGQGVALLRPISRFKGHYARFCGNCHGVRSFAGTIRLTNRAAGFRHDHGAKRPRNGANGRRTLKILRAISEHDKWSFAFAF